MGLKYLTSQDRLGTALLESTVPRELLEGSSDLDASHCVGVSIDPCTANTLSAQQATGQNVQWLCQPQEVMRALQLAFKHAIRKAP